MENCWPQLKDYLKKEWDDVRKDHLKKVFYGLWIATALAIFIYFIWELVRVVSAYDSPGLQITYRELDQNPFRVPGVRVCISPVIGDDVSVLDGQQGFYCDFGTAHGTPTTIRYINSSIAGECWESVAKESVTSHTADGSSTWQEWIFECTVTTNDTVPCSDQYGSTLYELYMFLFDYENPPSDDVGTWDVPDTMFVSPCNKLELYHDTLYEHNVAGYTGYKYPIFKERPYGYFNTTYASSFTYTTTINWQYSDFIERRELYVDPDIFSLFGAIGGAAGLFVSIRDKIEKLFELIWNYCMSPKQDDNIQMTTA